MQFALEAESCISNVGKVVKLPSLYLKLDTWEQIGLLLWAHFLDSPYWHLSNWFFSIIVSRLFFFPVCQQLAKLRFTAQDSFHMKLKAINMFS